MVKKRFDHRFIFDSTFYIENQSTQKLLTKLMYVSANSVEYKKTHNIMSEKDFKKIIEKFPAIAEEYLKTAFKKTNEPLVIEKIEDDIERNVTYAIYLANQTPHKTILFTSKSREQEYLNNSHLQGIKNVLIRCGEQAKDIIDKEYLEVTQK